MSNNKHIELENLTLQINDLLNNYLTIAEQLLNIH